MANFSGTYLGRNGCIRRKTLESLLRPIEKLVERERLIESIELDSN